MPSNSKKTTEYTETEQTHHWRHCSTVFALILVGVYCSHFKVKLFDQVYNWFAACSSEILVASLVALFLALGVFKPQASRVIGYLKITKLTIYNLFLVVVVPFIAFRFCESDCLIDRLGQTAVLIIVAWPLSLLAPLFRRATSENPTIPSDKCERSIFASNFSTFLINALEKEDNPHNRIAITAPWGTGKTDFLHRVIRDLKSQSGDSGIKTFCHMVTPWQAKNAEEAYEIIIGGVDHALGIWTPKASIFGKTISLLSSFLGFKTPSKEMLKTLSSSDSFINEHSLKSIDEQLENSHSRVVVFVDDMERIPAKKVRQLFPALNALKSLKNCIFVFAIDLERISTAYGSQEEAKGYINKIFDLNITLPTPASREILKLVNSEVSKLNHPFLYNSLQLLEPAYPRTPRATIQWLDICKAKEDMFFKDHFEYKERNFAAFYLKELIEYEFPGFEHSMRNLKMDSRMRNEQREANSVFVRKLHGMEDDEDSRFGNETDQQKETTPAGTFLNSNIEEKTDRFNTLYALMISLIEQDLSSARFSFTWACGEYTMHVGLTLTRRIPLTEAFIEAPNRDFFEITKKVFKDTHQSDYEATAEQFFDYFFSEEITDQMKVLHTNPEQLLSVLENLEALTNHLNHLSSLPAYLKNRHNCFLENFGMLPNLEKIDTNGELSKVMLAALRSWLCLLEFREIRGLYIRSSSQGWESLYEVHTKLNTPPKWKTKIDTILRECYTQKIAKLVTQNDFRSKFYEVNPNGNLHTFFLQEYLIMPKECFITCLAGAKFSENFVNACLLEVLKPNTPKNAVDSYFKQYIDMNEEYYSVLDLEAAQIHNPEKIITSHLKSAKELERHIKEPETLSWFKNSYLGEFYSHRFFQS